MPTSMSWNKSGNEKAIRQDLKYNNNQAERRKQKIQKEIIK